MSDTGKIDVELVWVPGKKQWHMNFYEKNRPKGSPEKFINEFYNCPRFSDFFQGIDYKKRNGYILTATPFHIEKDE